MPKSRRIGAWIIGAFGGVATTTIVGARAVARGLSPADRFPSSALRGPSLDLVPVADLVFGGCDLRRTTLQESAREIEKANRSLPSAAIDAVASDLAAIDSDISHGVGVNLGRAIERLVGESSTDERAPLRTRIADVQAHVASFQKRHGLDDVVVVNLASTEPPLEIAPEHRSLDLLEKALDADRADLVRSSLLYSYAALSSGRPYVNFTPSNAALVPAIAELARVRGVPFCGSDGKTGETLVKTALAPMFRHRALQVLTWQGYNILGDRDGEVLADSENLTSKVLSKDRALQHILGYAPHTHVGIDFVPSLNDLKTAWDFVHFEGFLGHRMSLQFIWQGCDAILAAPLVLDLIRFTELAHRRGESGPLVHLASYFKSPFACDEHDFHTQWRMLVDYASR